MPMIDHIDGPNRRIHLHADTANTSLDVLELYREVRAARRVDQQLRHFSMFCRLEGNIPKGGGAATERYLVLLEGTKLVPYDVDSFVQVSTVLIGNDGSAEGPGQFDRSMVTSQVDISYAPRQVEVINLATPQEIAMEVWRTERASAAPNTYGAVEEWTSVDGADAIADAVLDEIVQDHQSPGSLGWVTNQILVMVTWFSGFFRTPTSTSPSGGATGGSSGAVLPSSGGVPSSGGLVSPGTVLTVGGGGHMSGRRGGWTGRGSRRAINPPGGALDQYQTVHFDPFEIDGLIEQHGNLCEYRKAVPCPCGRIETKTASIGCKVCRGLRWIHPTRCDWRFLDSSKTARSQAAAAGRLTHGEMKVTFRMGIVPAEGDMVLPYCEEHVVHEQFHRGVQQVTDAELRALLPYRQETRPLRARAERLLYPDVLKIELVCWLNGAGDQVIIGSPDTDYTVVATEDGTGKRIDFAPGRGPEIGDSYSVRYLAPAAYLVMGSDPAFRHEGDVALPYASTLVRLDAYQERDQRADTAI